ncbi:glutathione S-transferase [Thecamonas trahens ATCC 50062]|uniref:Glutathione S-transferase n=1 Tax=Thecamonas trahens ATCC 50062 TaxID=461836 RepID=A0A0L0D936_THETB|nr:glutathione S-transferase [Thecamonas trahens ATCC 50062]KNC47813.1 glutathione S-transferase [Thecamonas trahens ATCC 50062]|eukprot:XP_013759291.1 glutathione S-transferase [Thecamonas trahens ATCC 50062]
METGRKLVANQYAIAMATAPVVVTYFAGAYGRGGPIKDLLKLTNVPHEYRGVTFTEFGELKASGRCRLARCLWPRWPGGRTRRATPFCGMWRFGEHCPAVAFGIRRITWIRCWQSTSC